MRESPMTCHRVAAVFGWVLAMSTLADAIEPGAPSGSAPLAQQPELESLLTQLQPGKDKKDDKKEPSAVDLFAQLPPPRRESSAGLNPNMLGDFSGTTGVKTFLFPPTSHGG